MTFQLIDDGTGKLRKVLVLSVPVNCAHPKCEKSIEAGNYVYHARLRNDYYCSSKCRNKHTRLLIQNNRRITFEQKIYERNNKLKAKYGLSAQDWDDIYDSQLGRCAICLIPLVESRPHVDHDHISGKVRGILCHTCNPGLGYFKDDVEILQRAINYLKAQRQRDSAVVGEEVTGQCL